MTRPHPIATRNGHPAHLNAPPRLTQSMVDLERNSAAIQDETGIDWFSIIGAFFIGAMLAVSFLAPCVVSL